VLNNVVLPINAALCETILHFDFRVTSLLCAAIVDRTKVSLPVRKGYFRHEVNQGHKTMRSTNPASAPLITAAILLILALVCTAANVDPDTPDVDRVRTRRRDGRTMTLRMSDEFSTNDRSFGKGDDQHFEAIHKPDYTNEAIQFCKFAFPPIMSFCS
jgi:hypothetical protein